MAKAGQAPAPYIAQKYAEAETAEQSFLSDDYDEPDSDEDLEVGQALQGGFVEVVNCLRFLLGLLAARQ